MQTTFRTTAAALLALMLFGAALLVQHAPAQEAGVGSAAPASNSQPAGYKVRIVRLSEVKGHVQLDRDIGNGLETALPNLPVTEGARLQTDVGIAEVEFEDNSTLRLTPDTLIEFPQLELRPTGAKVSVVHVLKGTVYASLANTKGNEFTLTFGDEKLILQPSSHIRLQVAPAQASLAVLGGNVQIENPSGTTVLGKKKTLIFDLKSQNQPTLAKNVAEKEYDAWDQNAANYHTRYMHSSAYGNVPYAYGISDMNYYGTFVSAAGCGAMWQPYFVSAAWDPYANGAWAWYPGAGYSWVSPYPWGWMPYHYGSWNFCQGLGWGWRPGGSWIGLANAPSPISPLLGSRGGGTSHWPRPVMPPRPPIDRHPPFISVDRQPLPVSTLRSPNTFVFRNNSAGLGIPRGSLGELGNFSHGVERHGSVNTPVQFVSIPAAGGNGRTGNAGAPPSLRQRVDGRTESGIYSRSSTPRVPGSSGSGRAGSVGGSGGTGTGVHGGASGRR